jgi:cytochrome P450
MELTSFAQPEVQRCPFPFIERLQKESPIYHDPITKFHVVTRYADIVYVSEHPELFSNTTSVILDRKDSPVAAEVGKRYMERGFLPMHTLVTNDPPSHTRFRALVDKVFTLRFIKSLEPQITTLVNELIDAFIDKGSVDFIHEFSIKLPMFMIADQLGVPQKDWGRFKLWSDVSIEAINPTLKPERELEITDLIIEMQQYLWARVQEYRKNPVPSKLLSNLANAEIDGELLEPRALLSITHQLLVAGNETTTSALAIGLWMLLENPAVKQKLSAEPTLIPKFVEEVLRMHAPSPHLYRQVLQDTEINGHPVKKDMVLMLSYLSGNQDETKFACPHQINLERENGRQHLGFGVGIHYCIGNQLARGEMRIAFERLLARLPNMQFDPDKPKPQFAPIFHVHALDSLNLVF